MGSTHVIPIRDEDGTTLWIEADIREVETGVLERADADGLSLKELHDTIRVLAQNVHAAVQHLTPSKVAVEVGLKAVIGTKAPISWVIKLEGEGSLKITLEWTKPTTTAVPIESQAAAAVS